jgi:hypothetical protein
VENWSSPPTVPVAEDDDGEKQAGDGDGSEREASSQVQAGRFFCGGRLPAAAALSNAPHVPRAHAI